MRRVTVAQGPFQALLRAQQQFQDALQAGTTAQMQDAQLAFERATDRVKAAQQRFAGGGAASGFMGRLTGLISSTRLNFSGGGLQGVAPLAGRLGGLFGGGAAGGPITLGLTAAVTALKSFTDTIHAAGEALTSFRSGLLVSGGTTENAAFLKTLGLTPELGNQLREQLSGGGLGSLAGFRAGMGAVLPAPYGPTNTADLLERFIKGVSQQKTPEERLRTLQMAGMPQLMEQVELFRRQGPTIQRDTRLNQQLFDPASQEKAAEFTFQLKRLGDAFNEVGMALGKAFIDDAIVWAQGFAAALKTLAGWINANQGLVRQLAGSFSPLIGIFTALPDLVRNLHARFGNLLTTFPQLATIGAALGRIWNTISGAFGKVVDLFQRLGAAFARLFSGRFSGDLFTAALDGLAAVSEWFANVLPPALDAVGGAFKSFVNGLFDFGKALGTILQSIGQAVAKIPGLAGLGGGIEAGGGALSGAIDKLQKEFNAVHGAAGANINATKANTDALKNATDAYFKQGTFGGAERTKRALQQRLPGYLPAHVFDAAVAGQAYRLGAF